MADEFQNKLDFWEHRSWLIALKREQIDNEFRKYHICCCSDKIEVNGRTICNKLVANRHKNKELNQALKSQLFYAMNTLGSAEILK